MVRSCEFCAHITIVMICGPFLSAETANAGQTQWGFIGIAPTAAATKISSPGIETINNRLGNSIILSVPQGHGTGTALGARGLYLERDLKWVINVSIDSMLDNVISIGTGAELTSRLSLLNTTGSLEWRLYPRAAFNSKQVSKLPIAQRTYVTVGPALGIASMAYKYNLVSRLNDSQVAYDSSSTLATMGAQATIGSALSPATHIGLGMKALLGVPTSTNTNITSFRVAGENLRYRGAELRVNKLTGSSHSQISAFASVSLIL